MIYKNLINKAIKIQKEIEKEFNKLNPEFNIKFKQFNEQFEEEWGKWEKLNKKKPNMP
ncbi:MAG: hypothetical protein N2486_01910 [Caloramator sp.]|nr:hypothetical protein [Caloramator sp.]